MLGSNIIKRKDRYRNRVLRSLASFTKPALQGALTARAPQTIRPASLCKGCNVSVNKEAARLCFQRLSATLSTCKIA